MLSYFSASLLSSNAQTVVNTVNTVGVMGKGIAAEFKKRYPEMYKRYRDLCKAGQFRVGQLWLWKGPDQWVLNFPTKEHWRNPSRLEYIEAGLRKFVQNYEERGITEAAFPRLGCGNGGLDWNDVRPLMEGYLARLPIRIDIHDFEKEIGLPEHQESPQEEFTRSFDSFLAGLREMIEVRNHRFHTVTAGSGFHVSLDDASGDLRIEGDGGRDAVIGISQDELYDVWSSLLLGPVTEDKLVGKAREEAGYLLPLLSTLPFVRPLEIGQNGERRLGVELLDRWTRTSLISEGPCQADFEWASHAR